MVNKSKSEEDIYYAALKEPPDSRSAYVKAACGDDLELLKRVESLLKIRETPNNFLESPPFIDQPLLGYFPEEQPGTIIDRYKLLEKIGEGGMAVVYMAEQTEPIRRKVALKIIKLGMDTKSVIARFEAERQALAMMDHPNIAKVLDAGATETGRPYFVMELVIGVSITEYCDKNNLNTKERLALFIEVCNAVQHAHQKGIIHRDIKPSNVMVTMHDGVPVPKVIDFGIAKATNQKLTEKTLFTRYARLIGTPAYMSPEQAELSDLDIDTRSDIYSLGVLLYELLTGATPFSEEELRKAGYVEMQRLIREEEPAKPSTKLSTLGETLTGIAQHRGCTADLLQRAVQGDLDWIVMKALEKNRIRRYSTASEFAQDIGRHLGDEPVAAGPPSRIYRSRKFVRRHRTAVISCLLVATALVAGLVASTVLYFQARQARDREAAAHAEAKRQAMISFAVNQFLNDDLLASVNPDSGRDHEVTVKDILDTAAERLEGKFEDAHPVEAWIRTSLGSAYQSIGKFGSAEPHLERAIELYRSQSGAEHPDTLSSIAQLGMLYALQGRRDEAEPLFVKVLECRRRVLGEEHRDTLVSMSRLGWLYSLQRRYDQGERLTVKALEIQQRVLGEEHPDTLSTMHNLGWPYAAQGRFKEAEPLLVKVLEIRRRVLGEEDGATLWSMNGLATMYSDQGRYREAEPLFVKVLEVRQRVLGEEHPLTARSMCDLARLHNAQARYNEAERLLVKALEIQQRILGEEHSQTLSTMSQLAGMYNDQGRHDEADQVYQKAVSASTKAIKLDPNNPGCWLGRAETYSNMKQWDNALADCTQAIELDPNNWDCWYGRADVYSSMNKEDKAAADYTKAIEFNPYNAHYWHRRGGSYLQLDEPGKAVADYTKAIELARTKAHYWYMRGVCYLQLGEPSKAVADYTKAIELDPNDAYLHYRRALAHLDMGDTEGYRDRCAQMLDHFGQTQEAVAAHWVAWTCALTANAVEDFNRLVELAEFAIEEGEKTVQNLTSLGAILYRSGRLDEAVQKLRDLATEWEQGTELPTETSPAYTWFFLAMAHHILGHADESQRYFELAVKRANQEMTGTAGWNRKLTLQLLQAEARSLLGVSERSSLSQKEVGSEKRN